MFRLDLPFIVYQNAYMVLNDSSLSLQFSVILLFISLLRHLSF